MIPPTHEATPAREPSVPPSKARRDAPSMKVIRPTRQTFNFPARDQAEDRRLRERRANLSDPVEVESPLGVGGLGVAGGTAFAPVARPVGDGTFSVVLTDGGESGPGSPAAGSFVGLTTARSRSFGPGCEAGVSIVSPSNKTSCGNVERFAQSEGKPLTRPVSTSSMARKWPDRSRRLRPRPGWKNRRARRTASRAVSGWG